MGNIRTSFAQAAFLSSGAIRTIARDVGQQMRALFDEHFNVFDDFKRIESSRRFLIYEIYEMDDRATRLGKLSQGLMHRCAKMFSKHSGRKPSAVKGSSEVCDH